MTDSAFKHREEDYQCRVTADLGTIPLSNHAVNEVSLDIRRFRTINVQHRQMLSNRVSIQTRRCRLFHVKI